MSKKDLLKETKEALLDRARDLEIPGRSKMSKEELATVLGTAMTRASAAKIRRARAAKRVPGGKAQTEKGAAMERRASRKAAKNTEKAQKRPAPKAPTAPARSAEKVAPEAPPRPRRGVSIKLTAPEIDRDAENPPGLADLDLGRTGASSSVFARRGRTRIQEVPEDTLSGRSLPRSYRRNKLVLLVKDPNWLFAYWEVTSAREAKIRSLAGHDLDESRKILRVYEYRGATRIAGSFDLQLTPVARSWYIRLPAPGRVWRVEIGYLGRSGRFYSLLKSNTVNAPRDRVSTVVDEEYASLDADFDEIFRLSGGTRSGSMRMLGGSPGKRIPRGEEDHWSWPVPDFKEMSSVGVSSFSSARAGRPEKPSQDDFFFWVDCELILHGGTHPDATVTVRGDQVKLRPDGTFTMRYALPDGTVELPVEAVRSDGKERRRAEPVVRRKTT